MLCHYQASKLCPDSVRVKVVENEDVVHASTGDEGEAKGKVGGDNTF